MELLDKYGLALLQLLVHSDNKLIQVDGHTLNIQEELEEVKRLKSQPIIIRKGIFVSAIQRSTKERIEGTIVEVEVSEVQITLPDGYDIWVDLDTVEIIKLQ